MAWQKACDLHAFSAFIVPVSLVLLQIALVMAAGICLTPEQAAIMLTG